MVEGFLGMTRDSKEWTGDSKEWTGDSKEWMGDSKEWATPPWESASAFSEWARDSWEWAPPAWEWARAAWELSAVWPRVPGLRPSQLRCDPTKGPSNHLYELAFRIRFFRVSERGVPRPSALELMAPDHRMIGAHSPAVVSRLVDAH